MPMNKNIKTVIYPICAVLVIAIIGLGYILAASNSDRSDNISGYPTVSILDNAQELYQVAKAEAHDPDHYVLTITSVTKTRIGNQSFTEETLQTVSSNGALIQTAETQTVGDYSIQSTLTYSDGFAYLNLGDTRFYGAMTEEEYRNRYAPVVMFDHINYDSCQAIYNGTTTTIYFSQATKAEDWAVTNYDTLREASGYAVLNTDNQLISSAYTIHYKLGSALIEETIELDITRTASSVDKPNADDYLLLENLDAPIALERACGLLLQTESASATITDTIICEAFGDHRTQETALQMRGIGDSFTAEINISATSVNSSRGGETIHKTQTITFKDQEYTITEDAGAPATKKDTDAAAMRRYCQNNLLGTILLPEYITSATVSEQDGVRYYSFTANEELSQLMSQSVCQILYQNPDLLNTMASAHTTNTMEGYLTIDVLTGLPLTSGIRYGSFYTIDSFPYPLQYISEQTYIIP